MEIHIQHRHPGTAPVPRVLRGNCGVVQKTIAAELVHRRVMPRRAAQPKGRRATVQHMIRRRQRHVLGRNRRLPCALGDRRFRSQRIISQPPIDIAGNMRRRHRARGPDRGYRLAAMTRRFPIRMAAFQKRRIARVMNRQHRIHAIIRRRDHTAQPARLDPLQDDLGAPGAFEGRHQFSAADFGP